MEHSLKNNRSIRPQIKFSLTGPKTSGMGWSSVYIANTIKPDDIKTLQEKIQYSFVQEDAALVKKIYDRGVSDGIEMGLNIGVKQGIEVKEAEIIRNLVSRGFDETTIAEIIGKPLNQIKDFSCLSCCALF